MPPDNKLTDQQKKQLRRLEPVLRAAAKRGDYDTAKRVAAELQDSLRATGHETRLMQIKNWLFEAALEAGKIAAVAIPGFMGVRQKTRRTTRVYLEATALLAICHLHLGDFDSAEPFITEALRRADNITSHRRRAQFRRRMIARFESEWTLASLRAAGRFEAMDPSRVEEEAGRMVQAQSDDDILEIVGRSVPPELVERIYRVYDFARNQIPPIEQKYLPSSKERRRQKEVGRTVLDAAKHVLWRSLCDPNSEVYKMWFTHGVQAVVNKKMIGAAVVAVLGGMTVGWYALAAALAATIFKAGLEVFCETAKPKGLMIGLDE